MKRTLILFTALIFMFSVKSQTTLDTAVNFSVKGIYGQTWTLFDILDQDYIVVIDFFSAACGTCQQYAPDMEVAYSEFGCNEGNVFFMGIDKGNYNDDVIYFNNLYGIEYPSASGMEGGGNEAHMLYDLQGTPSVVVIAPDRTILVHQIFPPSSDNIIAAVEGAGGIPQSCITSVNTVVDIGDDRGFYPNPASDFIHYDLKLDEPGEIAMEIIDLTGKTVMQSAPRIYREGIPEISLQVKDLPNGMYIARLKGNGKLFHTSKIIIDK